MATINLLPWRDWRRAERKRAFFVGLGAAAALGAALILLANLVVGALLQDQRERNTYLRRHLGALDRQMAQIDELQRQRAQLLDRMRVIQALQGNRPVMVRILDQLARTVPAGVFYTELRADRQGIAISGVAESNNQVSSLMRRLDASDWFAEPELEGVRADPAFGPHATTFNLTVRLQLPAAPAAEEN